MAAWRRFLEAHAALTRVLEDELERERRMPLAWYDVLVQLSEAPRGQMRMQELAASVLISKSGLTRLLDRIERAGLVRREPCAEDRRGTLAVLTAAGRRALRDAAPVHRRGIRQHFSSRISDAEARAIEAGLAKVLRALG